MELKFVEEKGSPKRDFRLSRARNQRGMKCNLLEAIAQVHGGGVVTHSDEDGAVRMKVVVRKQELKQMLSMMGSRKNHCLHQASLMSSSSLSTMLSLEQRIQIMRRRHIRRADHAKESRSRWRPVLQSIPEEL